MSSKQLDFFNACDTGDLAIVQSLSTQVDINWRNPGWFYRTGLHASCRDGRNRVVEFLLTLPRIDVNEEDQDGATPLWIACRWGYERAAKVLLASGKEIDTTKKTNESRYIFDDITAAEVAREQGHLQLAALIEEYERNPKGVTQRLRQELNYPTYASAVFAQIIFLSDGLLTLSDEPSQARRFLSIAERLPLDLQLLLANRSQGLSTDNVPAADRELAFNCLARAFLQN